jgi:hypothetical protein
MARWWQQDMSDAGQGLFSDPTLAIQAATMPAQLLSSQVAAQQAAESDARTARGGFIQSTLNYLKQAGHSIDSALSNVPGWGVVKGTAQTMWYPVDKVASGAHWVYSNVLSQPLSTLMLMGARTDLDTASWFSGDDWAETWHKANDISPAQAFANYENVTEAEGKGKILSTMFGQTGANLSQDEKNNIKRQTDKFLYDTEYWRDKAGWKYTVGTGSLDFALSMGADPTYAGVKVASGAIKGARSIQVAGQGIEASKSISGVNMLADYTGAKIGQAFAKTPEEISQSKKVNDFFDWSEGKSPWEISQSPIWGAGRRKNPAAEQLSSIFSQADRAEKPLIMRLAMGDNDAAAQLATKNKDLVGQLGRMQDNRQLLSSAKYEPAIFDHFMNEERAGRTAPTAPGGPGIGGTSSPYTSAGELVEAPYPRPTTPGPRQDGWDRTYGNVEAKAALQRQAVGDILKSGNGVRPMGGAQATSLADALRFEEWKGHQLDSLNNQIAVQATKQGFYQSVLSPQRITEGVEDFSPGASNIFGTMKQAYRMGPLALKDASIAADKSIQAQTQDRYGRQAAGGFVARTIRNGYYTVPLRVVQSFGDRLPQTMINHNDADAADRVLDMLKRVPGLGQADRLELLNQYSMAGDKVARSQALRAITSQVVDHMATNVHDLDPRVARALNEMIETGTTAAMAKFQGKQVPTSQMFSAAKTESPGGHLRADTIEDGEGYLITPIAKTQLSYSEPLLDVKELQRVLSRNSGFLASLKNSGGNAMDGVASIADSVSNIWKAATLLRPGYVLRAPSEEMAASAVKFGMISFVGDSIHGGGNWMRNRAQQLSAIAGKGSYMSTTGGGGHVQILDPAVAQAALARGDKVTKINVNKAWPIVMERIDRDRTDLKAVEGQIEALKKDPAHDPQDLQVLQDRAADYNKTISEHTDYANEILRQATDSTGRRLGEGTIEHQGVTVPQAFSKEWDNPIPRDQISSDAAMQTLFARGEAIDTARLMKTGNWVGVTPDDPTHMTAWLDAINKQWRQDDLFRAVAADPTLKTARNFLKTPAGKLHLSYLGVRAQDPERLLLGVRDTLDHYLPDGIGLRQKLAAGEEVTEAELRQAIAKEDFPIVHGEETKGLTAKGSAQTAARMVDDIIANGFKRLGSIPSDVMSRQPTYLRAQEARMRQMIDQELSYQKEFGNGSDTISVDRLNDMLKKSDAMARKDISQVVYDPTRTTATQALRFVAPFLSAHIDGLERWAGLVAEKPELAIGASKIYNAPVAANLVTDNQGNKVDENGYANVMGADGKMHKQFVDISNRTVHFKTPPGTRGLTSMLVGGNGKEIPISIQAMNTILPGDPWWNPGTGPIVSVAASALADKSPALGDFLQWAKVLPYGSQGMTEAFLPKYIKDAWDSFHPDSDQFQKAMLAEYQRQVADHANGGPVPDMKKAEENAKSFMHFKAFTSWISPAQNKATPLTGTPYQFYVDQFKNMQQVDPKNADENFLAKYGEDYFIFTAALSKSMGIAPTVSALKTSQMYSDLIAGDSSLAPFIIGDVYNKGDFSSSAYNAQMSQKIGGEPVRTKQTVQQAVEDNQRRLGWAEYGKTMNQIDAALIRTGFHSYTQKGAEGFLALKQQVQGDLAQRFPAWEQDFNTTDTGAMARRIKSFEILVQDPRLKNDPMRQDIPFLTQYLLARREFQAALQARGAKTLTFDVSGAPTGKNADIGNAWRAYQTGLVAGSTKFADVFNRYLNNDNLQ